MQNVFVLVNAGLRYFIKYIINVDSAYKDRSLTAIRLMYRPIPDAAPTKPRQRQYLPPLPGYIPVYIQDGETPPDVESLSDQSPTQDKMDTDVMEVMEPGASDQPTKNMFSDIRNNLNKSMFITVFYFFKFFNEEIRFPHVSVLHASLSAI